MPDVLNRGEVQAHIWGDLTDSERQLMFRRLRIKFENYRMGQYTNNWTLTAISLDSGKRWGCTVAFDDSLLMQTSPSVLNKVLVDSALQLAREMAPYLYAYDPRIGTAFSGNGTPLRACPLFDRPDGAGARQEYLLRKLYGTDYGEYTKIASSVAGGIPHQCPFCQESLHIPLTGKVVSWGGGHIGWVHRTCVNDHQDGSF